MTSKKRLENKVCIVTGAGSHQGKVGTGMATAICLAREGAKVIVSDISKENAMKTVQQIRSEKQGEAELFSGDSVNSDDCKAMVAKAVECFGCLNVLVNNVGYGLSSSQSNTSRSIGISNIDEKEWNDALDMNLNSAMLASRSVIPEMAKNGGGSIINISSCDALASADHYGAPYSVSKGAIHMLTRGIAAWHGREGIRANCIAPGHLHSSFTEHYDQEHRERRKKVVPLGTEGTPWDVGMAAVFLASNESRWISGVLLPVDGGLFAAQPMLGHDLIRGHYPSLNTS